MSRKIVLNKERDVTISPYPVKAPKQFTFLIVPGGAYSTCDENESVPVAKKLNRLGYNCFIFRYSVGKHYKWPYPLEDFELAMAWLHAHAEEYGADTSHIVTMGFSAGGHVVAVGASMAKRKPFAAVLGYGLVDRETLAFCAPDAPGADECVNSETPPMFLAYSRNDWIVPVHNAEALITALRESFIDYEAHIYAYAMHGFTVGSEAGAKGPLFCGRIDGWIDDCLAWLEELGSGRYKSVRECAQYNDKYAERLSTMNSCAKLEACPEAMAVLKRHFPIEYALYAAARKRIGGFMDTVSLRNLFELIKINEKTIDKIDAALSRF